MTATTKAIMLVTVVLMLVVVILSIALLAFAAHRNSSPDTTLPDGVPAAPAYIPSGTPSPYDLYSKCIELGFAPIRCTNTYLR